MIRYPKFFFRYLGLSMWFSKRINWIISEVQRQNFFLKVFSSSDKVLAELGSGSGTCLVFLHSFSFYDNVIFDILHQIICCKIIKQCIRSMLHTLSNQTIKRILWIGSISMILWCFQAFQNIYILYDLFRKTRFVVLF